MPLIDHFDAAGRTRLLETLDAFAAAVHATPNLDAVLDAACEEAVARLGCCQAAAFVDGHSASRGLPAEQLAAFVERAGGGHAMLAIDDLAAQPALQPLAVSAAPEGIAALVSLPLEAPDRHLGHWALFFREAHTLAPHERDLLERCAAHLATAALNALVTEELFARTQRLSMTSEISRELNSRLDLTQLLRSILEMSVLGVKATAGSLVAFDEAGGTLAAWEYRDRGLHEIELGQIDRMLADGLAGWVMRNRQAVHIPDTSRDARWLPKPGVGPQAALCLPLSYSDDVVGVMTLVHARVNGLTDDDLELLGAVADQAALAVQNARLYRAAEARAQQLATLNEVARLVTSTLDLNSVLELIVTKTLEILNAEAGSLILVEGPQRDLVFRVTRGEHPDQVAGLRLPWGTGLTGRVAAEGEPIISNDVRSDPRWFGRLDDVGFMRTIMILPLVARDEVVGVLTVINKRDGSGFTPGDVELISSFAGQAAVALQNARLFASTDAALARRVDELSALETITREIASTLDVRDVINVLLVRALAVTRAPRGLVALLSDDGASLQVVARHGFGGVTGVLGAERHLLPADQGVFGRVMRTGQPAQLRDAPLDPDFVDHSHGLTRALLCVPIADKRTVLGIIDVEADANDAFDGQSGFLAQLADHAALAIQNARLHRATETQLEATQRANRRIAALQEALAAVQSALDLGEVLQRVTDAVVSLGYEAVFLASFDESERVLTMRALSANPPELISAVETALGQRLLGTSRALSQRENIGVRSFLEGRLLVSGDPSEFWAPRVLNGDARQVMPFFGCGASLPLRTATREVGNMFVFSYRNEIPAEDLALLQTFADQAGVALDKARLFAEVRRVRDRLQAVLDSVRDGIAMFEADGRLSLFNPAMLQLLGLDPLALAKPGELLAFDDLQARLGTPERLAGLAEGLRAHPHAVQHRTIALEGLPRRYVEQVVAPVYGEGERGGAAGGAAGSLALPLLGWLVAWHDVTGQKELEQTREEFTHMLVHDLRSPLGAVMGGLSVARELLDEPATLNPETLGETVNLALDGSRHLLDLINGILDINKLESGQMPLDLQPTDVAALIGEVLRSLHGMVESTGVRLSAELPADLPRALADADQLDRVLTNLVANALKFTPAGRLVTVRAGAAEGKLWVRVLDEGPGVPAEFRTRIFEKFTQVPGARGRQKGTGLGLAFCRLAIEAHGGRIWVEPRPEGGSIFVFTLPLAAATPG
jgi:GAF domain-containing protein